MDGVPTTVRAEPASTDVSYLQCFGGMVGQA
jgi:hypothetical protein